MWLCEAHRGAPGPPCAGPARWPPLRCPPVGPPSPLFSPVLAPLCGYIRVFWGCFGPVSIRVCWGCGCRVCVMAVARFIKIRIPVLRDMLHLYENKTHVCAHKNMTFTIHRKNTVLYILYYI